jgi:ABC-type antimicrobial peptide transport system permease subunit
MRKNFIVTKTFFSLYIYNFEITNITYIQVFLVVSFLLMIFAIVTFANFMGVTIMNRKKDIGIIRAVGGSKNNIFKLFFVEGLVYCVIVSVFGLLFSFVFTLIFNSILIKGLLPGTTIIMFNLMNLLIVPLVSFIVMVLSTFIPVRKISKKPPVEIIRSI